MEELDFESAAVTNYDEGNIRHLSDMEHVRTRPGMYIGRLGDGSQAEDGIYVLLKEVIDNSIDEFKMNAGKRIEVSIEDNLRASIRDYGRGIPLGKLVEAVSMLNTGGKYDSKAFKKSVGLNGVGLKAVNALSSRFEAHSFRDGQVRRTVFEKGGLMSDVTEDTQEENGTYIFFLRTPPCPETSTASSKARSSASSSSILLLPTLERRFLTLKSGVCKINTCPFLIRSGKN